MECAVRAPGTRQRAPNKGRQIEFLIRVDKLTHFYWFANIPRPFLLPRRHPPNERRRRPSMQWMCYGRSHYSNLAAAVNMHVGLFYNSNRNLLHAYSVVGRAKFLYTACAFLTCFSTRRRRCRQRRWEAACNCLFKQRKSECKKYQEEHSASEFT